MTSPLFVVVLWALVATLVIILLAPYLTPSAPPAQPAPPPFQSFGLCVIPTVAFVGVQFAVPALAMDTWTLHRLIELLPAIAVLSTLALLIVVLIYRALGWLPDGPTPATRKRTILWFVASALFTVGGQLGAAWLQDALYLPVEEQPIIAAALDHPTRWLCFAIVFVVPIGEELLFRRVIYGTLREGTNRVVATLVSSVGFCVAHGNPSGFLVYVALGLGLCLAYEKTGRLWVPIAIHALGNLAAVAAAVT